MKKLYIILSVLFFISCDYSKNKEKIEQAREKAVAQIKTAEEEAVEDAKKRIAKITVEQLGHANDSIKNAIESAKTTIQAEVVKNVNSEINELKTDIRKSTILGVVGIIVGVIGVICAIYCITTRITKDYVRAKLDYTIYNNMDFAERIKDIVKPTVNNTSLAQTLTRRDVEKIIAEYLKKNESVDNKITPTRKTSINQQQNENAQINSPKKTIELFASNSSTMQLSDIQTSFQRGMSVYKLKLSSPDSNTAELTLCVEQADVKQRILINDSQFLSPICDVKKLTATPDSVQVKEQGMAIRENDGWKVIRKIFVEIK